MNPFDLSLDLDPLPLSSSRGKTRTSTPGAGPSLIRKVRVRKKHRDYPKYFGDIMGEGRPVITEAQSTPLQAPSSASSSQSPHGDKENAEARFACPFDRHNSHEFNPRGHNVCATKFWLDIYHLNRWHDSQYELDMHVMISESYKSCLLMPQDTWDPIAVLCQALKSVTSRTPEEEWQYIYKLLFPEDDRTVSPYHEPGSTVSRSWDDLVTSMTGGQTMGLKVEPGFSQVHTPAHLGNIPPPTSDQEAKGLKREIQSPQAPITKNIDSQTQPPLSYLTNHYLESHETALPSLPENVNPSRRETRYAAISSLPTDNYESVWRLSRSNSMETVSYTSPLSSEPSEEDGSQFSDFDSIDSGSRTYLSFSPAKRTVFDREARRFWSFYNELSVSYWFHLWGAHKTRTKAVSENQSTQRATSAASDTRTPSEFPSNYALSIAPKRKKSDDEDESNNNRNPPKRSNRTPLQKKGLNLACPFHKYKPWKYNHGVLRFRTCSTTPFDAIFRLKKQPVPIEGWTTEMDKKITRRKDELECERWERIYRELFGETLTDVPSPYFVPYDLASANEADLETLLRQEVPRIVLNLMRERIDNWETSHVERFLYTPVAMFALDRMIGSAIEEAFQIYRSATATANDPEATPTPKSSSTNPSIAGDSSSAPWSTWESTPIDPPQASGNQFGGFGFFPAVAPNDTIHPRATGGSPYSGHIREQAPPPAAELAPQHSEVASSSFAPDIPGQLQSAEEYMQQGSNQNVTSAYEAGMDDYMYIDLDFEEDFDDEAFPNVRSGHHGCPARP
ncbi:hypothetical protein V497_03256 [Pseudogymnoascus sp. VKM F-4516 (FW-969)]|nr:hypothetical protein V497_03256 [Pseudogymnoascus sp. VKM F-4516 (FW-969)]